MRHAQTVLELMGLRGAAPVLEGANVGLTELASAYLIEPRIADRLTAVWTGGPE